MAPASDYFSFGLSGTEDHMRGVGADHLLTPSEALGYLSPLDSPRLAASGSSPRSKTASIQKGLEEATSEPISSEELKKRLAEKEQTKEARLRGRQLSPSQLAAVLSQDPSPAPPPQGRFLHGGPPLSDLEAPSAALPNSEKHNKPIASSEWRAFSDDEEERLQAAWRAFQQDTEAQRRRDQRKGKETVKGEGGTRRVNEDEADPADSPYLVPVGLDNLFTVSLLHNVLYPAFWTGTPVRVLLCHWFYAPPSPPPNAGSLSSHQIKPYPVDPSLAAALDHAYSSIRPWDDAYAAELASALKGGKEAQQRLSVALGVKNEAGTEDNLGIEVIFENEGRGRVYSKGMMASVSKAFLSSGKSLGGGQVVLRGTCARKGCSRACGLTREFLQDGMLCATTSRRKRRRSRPRSLSRPLRMQGPQRRRTIAWHRARQVRRNRIHDLARTRRARHELQIRSGPSRRARDSSPACGTGSWAHQHTGIPRRPPRLPPRTRLPPAVQPRLRYRMRRRKPSSCARKRSALRTSSSSLSTESDKDSRRPTTRSLSSMPVMRSARCVLWCVLCLIRQSLTLIPQQACTTLSTSPALSPLLNGKRAQFVPVLWRAELDFDEVDESADAADEHLANRFGLADIEVPNSIPFLRQVVSGLVLDVPFYLSPSHKEKMLRSVVRECNRIYTLFSRRNPDFEKKGGTVSIIAHSLGSVMAADILSNQPTFVKQPELSVRTPGPRVTSDKPAVGAKQDGLTFAFDTRVLILVGSPLAFFLHLGKGQLIARRGRERTRNVGRDIALDRAGRLGCLACDSVYNGTLSFALPAPGA